MITMVAALALPAAVSAQGQTSVDSRVPSALVEQATELNFWQQLGDTTLNRLIAEVQRANLDVRAAEARVSGARSNRTYAALDLAPTATSAADTPGSGYRARHSRDRVGYFPTRMSGMPASTRPGSWMSLGESGATCRPRARWSSLRRRIGGMSWSV
jgi:outer membrane protein TolC